MLNLEAYELDLYSLKSGYYSFLWLWSSRLEPFEQFDNMIQAFIHYYNILTSYNSCSWNYIDCLQDLTSKKPYRLLQKDRYPTLSSNLFIKCELRARGRMVSIDTPSQGVATFSFARGAISSPSIPATLPATSRFNSAFSHSLAGFCIRNHTLRISWMVFFIGLTHLYKIVNHTLTFHEKFWAMQFKIISFMAWVP